jgi:hypothetical protein
MNSFQRLFSAKRAPRVQQQRVISSRFVIATAGVLALLWLPSQASAKVRADCNISYYTEAGWSREDLRSVEFVTGHEVLEHWPSIEAAAFYTMIWYGPGEVALVKLPTFGIVIGSVFQRRDFQSLFGFRKELEGGQVNLPNGRRRRWRVRPDSL